uniref:RAVE complex protein Rav1 C-terminal domain-containing protein n=1 Tax=Eptatretus burgeri TaxID=7764 RepID=A0A8C4Q1M2_EPTBU
MVQADTKMETSGKVQDGNTITMPGLPVAVSCSYSGRLAVAYKPARGMKDENEAVISDVDASYGGEIFVDILECESKGGAEWMLEQTLKLGHPDSSETMYVEGIEKSKNEYGFGALFTNQQLPLLQLDWVSKEDGSHLLTVGFGNEVLVYGRLSGEGFADKELIGWEMTTGKGTTVESTFGALPFGGSVRQGKRSCWVLMRRVELSQSMPFSVAPFKPETLSPVYPVALSWVRDGILIVVLRHEIRIYSQWQLGRMLSHEGIGGSAMDSSLGRDYSLFEAAHFLSPTLPQYHPSQLLDLIDLGCVRRARAILAHLVKCIAGEVDVLSRGNENEIAELPASSDMESGAQDVPARILRHHLSRTRTISVSGSTARDPLVLGSVENCVGGGGNGYTQIESVPPLPLYGLLAADHDAPRTPTPTTSGKNRSSKQSNNEATSLAHPEDPYADLIAPSLVLDEMDEMEGPRMDNDAGNVVNLSQFPPTYFGTEHAQVLSSHLVHASLPGLGRLEQMYLLGLADTLAEGNADQRGLAKETLDECGMRFLLAVRLHTCLLTSLPPVYRTQLLHQGLATSYFAWAFHSEAEDELLASLPQLHAGEGPFWSDLKSVGVGWWVRSDSTLRRCIEKVAKAAFQQQGNPLDAVLFYLALKKKGVIWGLFRSVGDIRLTEFFRHNFSEERWRRAAMKNAFSLLGRQRYHQAAAFFLLAGSLRHTIEVCLERLDDLQLALVVTRLYESEFDSSRMFYSILERRVLGHHLSETTSNSDHGEWLGEPRRHPDPFLRSIAYWVVKDYSRALETLLEKDGEEQDANPVVFSFYNYLRTHPLLLRRHYTQLQSQRLDAPGAPGKVGGLAVTPGTLPLSHTAQFNCINLVERRLFFTTANAHFKVGCPMLALEVLTKMPPLEQTLTAERSKEAEIIDKTGGPVEQLSPLASSAKDKAENLNWSVPIIQLIPEPFLELEWGCENESNEEAKRSAGCSPEPSVSLASTGVEHVDEKPDSIAQQLKFRACLKILMTELRTLATGFGVEGGKLRFQLHHWLEREVAAISSICRHQLLPTSTQKQICGASTLAPLSLLAQGGDEEAGIKLRGRRCWLKQNQPLLRMLLSYCNLHGARGGGLASVRTELVFLLQESHQDLLSPPPPPGIPPLLVACLDPPKTVIANPLCHLQAQAQDILNAVSAILQPPHPLSTDPQVDVMFALAASLSACIYQSLCHSPLTSFEVVPFSGMTYDSERGQGTGFERMAECAVPTTLPAEWPGSNVLPSQQVTEAGCLQLRKLLTEALVAVYLAVLTKGLASGAPHLLTALAHHPLDVRAWAAVFGGGFRQRAKQVTGPARRDQAKGKAVQPEPEKRRRFSVKMLVGGKARPPPPQRPPPPSLPSTTTVPCPTQQKFVPPELSMWDYFLAKPFLPPSELPEIDSEDSEGEDDVGEDNICLLEEHSDPNSYSWFLIRLALTKLAIHNLKSFLPVTGIEISDLSAASPLIKSVLHILDAWESHLRVTLESRGGPPPNYVNAHPNDGTDNVLQQDGVRLQALTEPGNTPFRSARASAMCQLWRTLVQHEVLQETFLRYVFTRRRSQQAVEADLGFPGLPARIIHKESDVVSAFALNKANGNLISVATSHDVQELDLSAVITTSACSYVDEMDVVPGRDESAGTGLVRDNWHGSSASLHTVSSTVHAAPQPLPWLGGGVTSIGSTVTIRRNLSNVKRLTSHPTLPYYITGAQDGSVRLFEWNRAQQVTCFRQAGNARATCICFNNYGNKFGVSDGEGFLSLWQTNSTGNNPKPFQCWQCHTRCTSDFTFVCSSTLIATAGQSQDNRNVCVWDTLLPANSSLVQGFTCHESGAMVLAAAARHQMLVSAGRRGMVCVWDLRQRRLMHSYQAHDSAVKALALDPTEQFLITGSTEGNIKVWNLTSAHPVLTLSGEHARHSLIPSLAGSGVLHLCCPAAGRLLSCGGDGTIKLRVLPQALALSS